MKTNVVHCGECVAVMRDQIPDNSIDLTVTSPPYDRMDEDYNLIPTLRDYNGYSLNFADLAAELWRVTKPGGVVVWVVGDATIKGSETGVSFRQALYFMGLGFNLHDTMIYQKLSGVTLNHNRYEQDFEYMFVFSKGSPKDFNPIKIPCRTAGTGARPSKIIHSVTGKKMRNGQPRTNAKRTKIKGNIWEYLTGGGHTTSDDLAGFDGAAFPEALARDHIISWSNLGDIVLDPMAGSGTAAKMAIEQGRQWIAIEISPEYCEIIRQRVAGARVPLPGIDNIGKSTPKPTQAALLKSDQ